MRWVWRVVCGALILVALTTVAVGVHLRLARQRDIDVARLAITPLMTPGQFRREAQNLRYDRASRSVAFTVKGTNWLVRATAPPAEVPAMAAQGNLLAAGTGEVLYPGEIGRLLGALPARVATYEFPGKTEGEVRGMLEKEGWKDAKAMEEELRGYARAHGLDPTRIAGGEVRLPGMGGKLLYPPLDTGTEPET